MIKKFLAIIIFFYILILFQASFLVHFDIFWSKFLIYGFILSLIAFLTLQNQYYSLIIAFIVGFFLDIFSGSFIGFHILILIGLVIFIKFILQKYVQIPIFQTK